MSDNTMEPNARGSYARCVVCGLDKCPVGRDPEVRRPSCYHQVNDHCFYNELPNFVKLEDVIRRRKA